MKWIMTTAVIAGLSGMLSAADLSERQLARASGLTGAKEQLAGLVSAPDGGVPLPTGPELLFSKSFSEPSLAARQLGLKPGEVVITFDDGPSVFTAALASHLGANGVPAVYFMNFNNADGRAQEYKLSMDSPAGREAVKTVCAAPGQLPANHTDNHSMSDRGPENLGRTARALEELCPKPFYFFRPPGGNWQTGDDLRLNSAPYPGRPGVTYGQMYAGPVRWDVTGEDWQGSCQGDIPGCRESYLRMTTGDQPGACRGGVLLFHDIYPSTMELVLGREWKSLLAQPSQPLGADGLIAKLRRAGCSIVGMDSNREVVRALLGRSQLPLSGAAVTGDLTTLTADSFYSVGTPADRRCNLRKGDSFEYVYETDAEARVKVKLTKWLKAPAKGCSALFTEGREVFLLPETFEFRSLQQ